MQKAKLVFSIQGYWHVGSGSGQGANLDALVVKTPAGLPYLPGKSVKGLLREALQTAEEYGHACVGAGTTQRLCGTFTGNDSRVSRFDTEPGSLAFTNAVIEGLETWAVSNSDKTAELFTQISSTSIDNKGIAASETLRRIEVAVPLTLVAVVETTESGGEWISALQAAATLVRGIGAGRNRGFGRCQLEVKPW